MEGNKEIAEALGYELVDDSAPTKETVKTVVSGGTSGNPIDPGKSKIHTAKKMLGRKTNVK